MEIAVLGGGNGSLAAAADLSSNGHKVRYWRRNSKAISILKSAQNIIRLKDFSGTKNIKISKVTSNISEAIKGAELIVCPIPATGQLDIANLITPHLESKQVVLLPPGSFGSWIMAKSLDNANNKADVSFSESGTLPYLARLNGPQTIAITTRATRLPTGIFPLKNKTHALSVLKKAYPAIEDCGDILSAALMNAGPIIHPPLIVMNAGPIEHFDYWDIHNEGTQPAIRKVTTSLDNERIKIRKTLGYHTHHFPLADHYNPEGEEWMYGNVAHEKLIDSGDWREKLILTEHRYMREDIEIGLAFMVSVAKWANVATPVAEGLLSIGSAVCCSDFAKNGRTIENLNLSNYKISEIQTLLKEGFK
jgi:opine dehydrogenase